MIDPASESRLQAIHPVLASKVCSLIETLSGEGISVHVIQGLRTYQEQDSLYAQGRTKPGKVITNARGGESYHNYGLAVDLAPGLPGKSWVPDWKDREGLKLSPHYQRMVDVGTQLGLVSGSHWHHCDDPHFQMTGNQPEGKPTATAEAMLRLDGLEAVWKFAGLEVTA